MIFRGFQALAQVGGGRGKVRNLAPRSRLRDGMRPSIRVPVTAKRNESGRVRSSSSLLFLLLLLVN